MFCTAQPIAGSNAFVHAALTLMAYPLQQVWLIKLCWSYGRTPVSYLPGRTVAGGVTCSEHIAAAETPGAALGTSRGVNHMFDIAIDTLVHELARIGSALLTFTVRRTFQHHRIE